MVPFEIQEKNYDLGEQLSESRINMCGIGTRKVKLFLNRKVKQGDTKAQILRIALEAEDANISAKQYWGDYKYQYYEKKADKIHDLISLYEKDKSLVFGISIAKAGIPITSFISNCLKAESKSAFTVPCPN